MNRSTVNLAPAPVADPAERRCELCRGSRFARRAFVDRHQLLQCRACGLVFVQQSEEADRPKDYYQDVSYEQWEACYREFKAREFQGILDELKRLGASGRLLDVGCSYGWFIRQAAEAGFEAMGIEPSQAIAQAARTQGTTPPILVGDVALLDTLELRFNVITLLDVLEHLHHPRQALDSARRRLTPDGLLVLRVPDVRGLIHQTALWAYALSWGRIRTPIEAIAQVDNECMHVFFFEVRTVTRLLAETGFRVVGTQGCEFFENRRVSDRIRLSGQGARYARWDHPVVPLALEALRTLGRWTTRRDEVVVYARPA